MPNKIYEHVGCGPCFGNKYEFIGTSNDGVIVLKKVGQSVVSFTVSAGNFEKDYKEYKEPEKRTKYINIYRHTQNGKITLGNAVERSEADKRATALSNYGHELIGRSKVEIVEGHFDD